MDAMKRLLRLEAVKRLARILFKNKIALLFCLAFSFAFLTLITQLILLDLGGLRSSSNEALNILKDSFKSSEFEAFFGHDYDLNSCKEILQLKNNINDLKNMQYSFLTEIKNLETSRNNLLKKVAHIQNSLEYFKIENDKLINKNKLLKFRILSNLYKIDEFDVITKDKFDLIDSIQTSINLSNNVIFRKYAQNSLSYLNSNFNQEDQNEELFCTIEDCFNFKSCPLNKKLSVHLFTNNSTSLNQINYFLFMLNEKRLNASIELLGFNKLSDACLVVLFLVDINNTEYYQNLINFMVSNGENLNNLIFIDLSNEHECQSKFAFMRFIMNLKTVKDLKQLDRYKLNYNLKRAMFASFTYMNSHYYDNLFIHYSFIFDIGYINDQIMLKNTLFLNTDHIYQERKYLISYHQAYSDYNFNKLNLIQKMLESYSTIKFNFSFNCENYQPFKSNPNDLCFNLEERTLLLFNSSFTLIIPNQNGYFWSFNSTYRLIESLKCSTIPVLIDSNLKLPLDDLIAWDEVVIRLPFSRINYLVPIINSMDQSDISNRQIKARNIYNSYFSSLTNQFQTLFAAIRSRLSMPSFPIQNYAAEDIAYENMISLSKNPKDLFKKNMSSDFIDPNDELNSYVVDITDGDDDVDSEFLGQINQKPIDSIEFSRNFTQSKYLIWNKIFYPFNSFSSIPFDGIETNDNRYVKSFSENLRNLNYSIYNANNLNDPLYNNINDPIDPLINENQNFINFTEFSYLKNFTLGGGDGKYFNHYLGGNSKEEQFTIVILSFKREPILIGSLDIYLKLPYLHSIIVIWNALDTEPSYEFKLKFNYYLSSKRLHVIKPKKNSLNNRFLPYDIIKTDAVLNLDDDTVLRPDEVIFGFRVWRENRDKIVGYPARFHTWNYTSNNFGYSGSVSCEYSMVLTGAAFYHRFYHHAYTHMMDERIRFKVDEIKNCEDIAFNMLVSHLTRKPPLKVTVKWRFACKQCETLPNVEKPEDKALSLKPGHYIARSECIKYFISIYGYNPLLYSQYRADSVLYKTKLPMSNQKCFNYV